jgi:septal ring factor EnvC (AmiA/AmiB activator)
MVNGESKGKVHYINGKRIGQAVLVIAVLAATLHPFSTAEAGILDRAKDIYRLPEQVNSMEKEYEAVKLQLQEQQDKLAETVRQSKETEERLIAQNKQLLEQNEALQKSLQAAEKSTQERQAQTRRLTIMGITVVILVVGYFLSGRLIRVAVWRRQKGSLHK